MPESIYKPTIKYVDIDGAFMYNNGIVKVSLYYKRTAWMSDANNKVKNNF